MSRHELKRRLGKLEELIKRDDFYEEKGLGNEVPFYIFDYDPKEEVLFRNEIKFLTDSFNRKSNGKKIELVNVFELIINVLEEKQYVDKSIDLEKRKGKETLLKALRRTLRLTLEESIINTKIKEKVGPNKVIFLLGIGTAWPIIRGSELLNNLHAVVTENPLVLFYPGTYNESELKLFNKIKSEHYYRAFNIEPRIKGGY